jgi:nucleoside-diphosphate-sugar epimerase
MNILITGGAGYLGSALVPKLLLRGHNVGVVDIGYFGLGHLRNLRPPVEVIRADLRRVIADREFRETLLCGRDCVIHLAAISNDPSAEAHPHLTDEVNYRTTVALAKASKERGIRFLFSSSCSVYGEAHGDLPEDGAVNPLTCYALSKVRSEEALFDMATREWRPVVLRNGTLFGYSPRMRFDLVVNVFALYSTLHNEIQVFGDGSQWRPFLSVQDCARAFVHLAEATNLDHLCYNVAHENLRIVDVAAIIKRINPPLNIRHMAARDLDRRDYKVTAARLLGAGFRPQVGVEAGAEGVAEAIICGLIPDPESIFYQNAKWLQELTHIRESDHLRIVDFIEGFSSIRTLTLPYNVLAPR